MYFDRTKKRLEAFLKTFFERKIQEVSLVRPWGKDMVTRLASFTNRGKMIRGGLVCLGYEMTKQKLSQEAVQTGAALELVQSALLIHDDIMDRDTLRRGEPAFHQQYVVQGYKEKLAEPDRFGENMGICAGEIALFFAVEVMASVLKKHPHSPKALELMGKEFVLVGLGQMQDLYSGASPHVPSEKAILSLYKLKTAGYSFSLPLQLGCLLASGGVKLRKSLQKIGEGFGLIFQLKDDELGLFGDEAALGKPIGSDIKQGKKTLHALFLKKRVSPEEHRRLDHIFGNPAATEDDIALVRVLSERYDVRAAVVKKIEKYRREIMPLIQNLPVETKYRAILEDLLAYSLIRER